MMIATTYGNLTIGDTIIDHVGGSLKVTDIRPYVYPSGEHSARTIIMSFYGECSGKGSCKHAYPCEVSFDGKCNQLVND